ncbi:MAG: winged helix-turn-helix transcriptional regulator [Nitrospirae bacterium]|nr:winged helix-turn-helix transcriptional regulator [Nitrospirota bacterium]
MNVQNMNNEEQGSQDTYKSLLLLDEISKGEPLSQRDLSKKLNIALGLVNSYIKNLVSKGYVTVKAIPAKRYAYYLTPKGFAEKTRLAYDLLHDYTRIYREARENLKQLFKEMSADGVKKVVFAGADEVAEIAYITLQETDLELTGVVDGEMAGKKFFGFEVRPMDAIDGMSYDCLVVTTHLKREKIYGELLKNGVKKGKIKTIFVVN